MLIHILVKLGYDEKLPGYIYSKVSVDNKFVEMFESIFGAIIFLVIYLFVNCIGVKLPEFYEYRPDDQRLQTLLYFSSYATFFLNYLLYHCFRTSFRGHSSSLSKCGRVLYSLSHLSPVRVSPMYCSRCMCIYVVLYLLYYSCNLVK